MVVVAKLVAGTSPVISKYYSFLEYIKKGKLTRKFKLYRGVHSLRSTSYSSTFTAVFQYIANITMSVCNSTFLGEQCILSTGYSRLSTGPGTAHCLQVTVHCIYRVQYTVYRVQYTVYRLQYTVYRIQHSFKYYAHKDVHIFTFRFFSLYLSFLFKYGLSLSLLGSFHLHSEK